MFSVKSIVAFGSFCLLFTSLLNVDAGHLPGSGAAGNVELVGSVDPGDAADLMGDVTVSPDGNWAFVASLGDQTCTRQKNNAGPGVWIVDISNPANPQAVNFISSDQDTRPGDRLQVVAITTKFFSGWALVVTNAQCGKNGKGGISLFDVTDPLKAGKLSEHFGATGFNATSDTQTAFAWDAGDQAYVVINDGSRPTFFAVVEITNPMRPRLTGEYDLDEFPNIVQTGPFGLDEISFEGVVVKHIGGQFVMLISAADAGHVLLNITDPTNAVYISDSDFAAQDPILDTLGIQLPPEGNSHYAEFSADNRFFIGTDEDLSPFRGTVFDGWGYAHLYSSVNGGKLEQIDVYAIAEAFNPAFAFGFGNLSVHEVATHPSIWSKAYLAYNAGGLRALEIQCESTSPHDCAFGETGRYLDPQGSDMTGVEVSVKGGQTYILASDRDRGLQIFRDVSTP